jgi:hypothetical protein
MTKILFGFIFSAISCFGTVAYQNTDTDQLFSVFYSTGYTEIGDQLQLTGSSTLTSLDAQFYNAGDDATFDAVLRFYFVGSPVGAAIGGPFTVTNISIASGTSQTVSFLNLANILVPQNVIATLAAVNVSTGGDIGVNFFDPPSVGSSSNQFFIANDGSGLAQASTNMDIDNLYFSVESTAVPEPGTLTMALAGTVLLGLRFLRQARSKGRAE